MGRTTEQASKMTQYSALLGYRQDLGTAARNSDVGQMLRQPVVLTSQNLSHLIGPYPGGQAWNSVPRR